MISNDYNNLFPVLKERVIIRNDKKRAVIYRKDTHFLQKLVEDIESDISYQTLGPSIAAMLVLMDGTNSLSDIFSMVESYFKLQGKCAEHHRKVILEEVKYFYQLMDTPLSKPSHHLDIEQILPPYNTLDTYDTSADYLYYPQSFLIIPHMVCNVSCIYCYADRKQDCKLMSIHDWKKILSTLIVKYQPKELMVSGGDIFLYPHWKELLSFLASYEYFPELPTKSALTEEEQQFLYDLGFRSYQISLDSVIPEVLHKHLQLNDFKNYTKRILHSIETAEHVHLKITVNSIQTHYSVTGMYETASELMKYKNIHRVSFDSAGYSLYLGNKMKDVMFTEEDKNEYLRQCERIRTDFDGKHIYFKINDSPSWWGNDSSYTEDDYWKRSFCSGGRSGLILLPDGKVTCCEELYWLNNYILGDLRTDSWEQIFDSNRRWELLQPSQAAMPEKSPCRYCEESKFMRCTREKGRCWRDSLKMFTYHDYPDQRCPFWTDINQEKGLGITESECY